MGLFRSTKKALAPHIVHPKILHWKEGDEIVTIDYGKLAGKNRFHKLTMHLDWVTPKTTYFYKSITQDGFIIIKEKETEQLHKIDFIEFIKQAKNISFQNRSIENDLEQSNEYMELIGEFQKTFTELVASDKKKLLG